MSQMINKLNELHCTPKTKVDIQSFGSGLSARERQLLLLMNNDAPLCHLACEKLLEKVDVVSLIERGYLSSQQEDDETLENSKETLTSSSPATAYNSTPLLDLLAGHAS